MAGRGNRETSVAANMPWGRGDLLRFIGRDHDLVLRRAISGDVCYRTDDPGRLGFGGIIRIEIALRRQEKHPKNTFPLSCTKREKG